MVLPRAEFEETYPNVGKGVKAQFRHVKRTSCNKNMTLAAEKEITNHRGYKFGRSCFWE
jgi:hypothetical protein